MSGSSTAITSQYFVSRFYKKTDVPNINPLLSPRVTKVVPERERIECRQETRYITIFITQLVHAGKLSVSSITHVGKNAVLVSGSRLQHKQVTAVLKPQRLQTP